MKNRGNVNKIVIGVVLILLLIFVVLNMAKTSKVHKIEHPLQLAVSENSLDEVKYLINNGADVNFQGYRGRTPLFIAAKYGNTEIAQYLISVGADVNIKDDDGLDPLHMSTFSDNPELSKILIESKEK